MVWGVTRIKGGAAPGFAPATAWTGWTLPGANALFTLPAFNRGPGAIGKVYVAGYDGSKATPSILAQAVISPFDGRAPVITTVRLELKGTSVTAPVYGLVALEGLDLNGSSFVDSFDSNPTHSVTGPWSVYASGIAHAKTTVVVLKYNLIIGGTPVQGDVLLGAGSGAGAAWKPTGWLELQSAADRATVAGLTGNYLR